LHILIVFTPVYYLVMRDIMAIPAEIIEPTRYGMMIMTPWTFGTAYRRFQHGVLIRFGHSRIVIWGSFVRLGVDILILVTAALMGGIPGIIAASSAIIIAVIFEAAYAGLKVRPVLRDHLKMAPALSPPLTLPVF
jgi:hypothetical protein